MYTYNAYIYNIVDGDTVDATIDLGFKILTKQRIRLSDIDTPERGEAGYAEATERLKELILGKNVILNTTKASKWGYYLGKIYTLDQQYVNEVLLKENLAKPYTGGTKNV